MTPHGSLDDTDRDNAALYALDSLPTDATEEFEAHLEACPRCRDEVRSYDSTVEALALASPEVIPSPALYDKLRERTRSDRRPTATPSLATPGAAIEDTTAARDGFSYVRAAGATWMPSGVPGVIALPLQVDHASGRVTMLVRMEPGAAYPRHRHATTEECYVLRGDVSAHGIRLTAGDRVSAEAASVHGVQSTEAGCLLLLIGSLHDEVLVDAPPESRPT